MRCLSCDRRLSDRESSRKYSTSGTYLDLCDRCFGYIADEVPVIDEGINGSDLDFDDLDLEDYDEGMFLGGTSSE